MSSRRSEKTSARWRPKDYPGTSILKRVHWFLILDFCRNVLATSYKVVKVTSRGWRSRDVHSFSFLHISIKRVSVVILPVLVHQTCLFNVIKLVFAYSFSFGETSVERPKNVSKWHPQCDNIGTSSGCHLNHYPLNRICIWCFVETI